MDKVIGFILLGFGIIAFGYSFLNMPAETSVGFMIGYFIPSVAFIAIGYFLLKKANQKKVGSIPKNK